MINRIIGLILCVVFPISVALSVSAKDYHKEYEKYAIEKLQSLDVVRDPFEKYDEKSTISRRNMFEMVYIVVNATLLVEKSGRTPRQYLIHPNPNKNFYGTESLEDCMVVLEYMEKEREEYDNHYYEFEDVGYASDDHFLAFSLMGYSLINGVEKNGKRYAEFDRAATKSEAITAICYIFDPLLTEFFGEGMDGFKGKGIFDRKNYIELAKELKVIDEDYPVENLDEPINAYEFMNMLYNALNIPFDLHINGWSQTIKSDYHYVDALSEFDIAEANPEYEAINH